MTFSTQELEEQSQMSCATGSSQCCITHRRRGVWHPHSTGNRRKGGWFLPGTQGRRWCLKAWLSLGPAVEHRSKTQTILLAVSQEVRFAKLRRNQNLHALEKNPQTSNPDSKLKPSGQLIQGYFSFYLSLPPTLCLVLKKMLSFHSQMFLHVHPSWPDISWP